MRSVADQIKCPDEIHKSNLPSQFMTNFHIFKCHTPKDQNRMQKRKRKRNRKRRKVDVDWRSSLFQAGESDAAAYHLDLVDHVVNQALKSLD